MCIIKKIRKRQNTLNKNNRVARDLYVLLCNEESDPALQFEIVIALKALEKIIYSIKHPETV